MNKTIRRRADYLQSMYCYRAALNLFLHTFWKSRRGLGLESVTCPELFESDQRADSPKRLTMGTLQFAKQFLLTPQQPQHILIKV